MHHHPEIAWNLAALFFAPFVPASFVPKNLGIFGISFTLV